jgi:hypothetical protein
MLFPTRLFHHSHISFQTVSCNAPPNLGPYADTSSFSNSTKVLGSTMNFKCKKWSAFNAAQLYALGYSSNGASPTVDDRFKSITLTCGRDGLWLPKPDRLPQCQGEESLRPKMTQHVSFYRGLAILVYFVNLNKTVSSTSLCHVY